MKSFYCDGGVWRPLAIGGAKGGKGGADSSGGSESPDNLFSDGVAYIIDLISEGEIEGWADPDNPEACIRFDNTPLRLADGSLTVDNVEWWLRTGTADQSSVPGFSQAESERAVGVEVTQAQPVTRTITDTDIDALRVTITVPQLTRVKDGNLGPSEVEYVIETQVGAAAWQLAATEIISGKTTSGFQRATRIELPETRPVSIRVRRITDDSDGATITNAFSWSSYTEIIDVKLTYPHSAYVALAIPADAFGGRLPTRTYDIRGVKLLAPSNYDPEARTYDEATAWDGSLVEVAHSNPVWALYTAITQNRWGLGDKIGASSLPRYLFYEAGKYADEMIDDGAGGMRPRYTINGPLKDRAAAYSVLRDLASTFRGQLYWGSGVVVPTWDAPADPVALITNANAEGGAFSSSGTSKETRYNRVVVSWRDPDQDYELAATIVYEDPALIARYGLQETSISLPWCTSRAEAMVAARWLVDTNATQTDAKSWAAGLDAAALRPGDVVALSDKDDLGWRAGGRVVAIEADAIEIDQAVELDGDETYTIWISRADLSDFEELPLSAGLSGALSTLPLAAPHGLTTIEPGAIWVIADEQPPLYKIISLRAAGPRYELQAVNHDPTKFARVESGIRAEEPEPYLPGPTGALAAPLAVEGRELLYRDGSAIKSKITVSVTPPADGRVAACEIAYREPGRTVWDSLGLFSRLSGDVLDTGTGTYGLRARVVDALGRKGAWRTASIVAESLLAPPAAPTAFRVSMRGENATFKWETAGELDLSHIELRHNSDAAGAWEASQLVTRVALPSDSITVAALAGRYLIKTVDLQGIYSREATALVIVPELLGEINAVSTSEVGGSTGWASGTLTDAVIVDDALELSEGGADVGYYELPGEIDLGELYSSRVSGSITALGKSYSNRVGAWGVVAALGRLTAAEPDAWSVAWEMATAADGSTPVGEWRELEPGDYLARRYKRRLRLTRSDAAVTPRISAATLTVDMPDRVERVRGVTAPAAGLDFTYGAAFREAPALVITPQDLQDGDSWSITSESETGFSIQFSNGGGGVERMINILASGYGRVET